MLVCHKTIFSNESIMLLSISAKIDHSKCYHIWVARLRSVGWISSAHGPQCNNLKWASFSFITPYKWEMLLIFAIQCVSCPDRLTVSPLLCVMVIVPTDSVGSPYICFSRWGRCYGGESTVVYDNQGGKAINHTSTLNWWSSSPDTAHEIQSKKCKQNAAA